MDDVKIFDDILQECKTGYLIVRDDDACTECIMTNHIVSIKVEKNRTPINITK